MDLSDQATVATEVLLTRMTAEETKEEGLVWGSLFSVLSMGPQGCVTQDCAVLPFPSLRRGSTLTGFSCHQT